MGFAGDIWPVHPTRDEVHGRRCYRSVADLPGAPDAAFVGVNRQLTIEIVRELAERGAGGAICYASGFREAEDGAALQDALLEAAGDMPILGPNCYGLINYLDGALLWPDQHGGARVEARRRDRHAELQHRHQHDDAAPRPADRLCRDRRQPGADRPRRRSPTALLEDSRVTAIGLHVEGIDDVVALRGDGVPRARARQADRRDDGRALGAVARGDDLAHRVDRRRRRRRRPPSSRASASRACAPSPSFWRR